MEHAAGGVDMTFDPGIVRKDFQFLQMKGVGGKSGKPKMRRNSQIHISCRNSWRGEKSLKAVSGIGEEF